MAAAKIEEMWRLHSAVELRLSVDSIEAKFREGVKNLFTESVRKGVPPNP